MIISCKQLIQLRAVDPDAFKNVTFQKYEGNNGPCVATVEGPMNIEEALAYSHEVEASGKVKPASEKQASGQAYSAGAGA